MCVGAYKGKTEEEPRAEVRRTFWKFEWDSKPPGEESWYLQSEEREKCPGIGSMFTVCGVKVPPKFLAGPSWQGGFVSPCRRQDRWQRDGNQPCSSRTLLRKVAFPARVCLGPLAILNFHVYTENRGVWSQTPDAAAFIRDPGREGRVGMGRSRTEFPNRRQHY